MSLSGGGKTATSTQNKNIQQILIFFTFFKFMLLKFSAYLSHKYYRAFSFVRCCMLQKAFIILVTQETEAQK
jgi:hypothetical protein